MFTEYVTILYPTNANIHIYHEQIGVINLFLFDCLEKILSIMLLSLQGAAIFVKFFIIFF